MMKLKGISLFEQHIDKLIIGAALCICVGIGLYEFLGKNEIKLDAKTVTPGEIDPLMKAKAEEIALKLRDDAPAGTSLDASNLTKVADGFAAAISQRISPSERLANNESRIGNLQEGAEVATGDAWYFLPILSPPVMITPVMQTADALADGVVEKHPDLAAKFSNPSEPKDLTWTTPAAAIPIGQWRTELHRNDTSADPARVQIPPSWYDDAISTLDIVLNGRNWPPMDRGGISSLSPCSRAMLPSEPISPDRLMPQREIV